MKKVLFLFITLLFFYQGYTSQEDHIIKKAKEFLELVNQKSFVRAAEMFNEVLLAQLPGDKLSVLWGSIEMQAGKFIERTDLYSEKVRGYDVIVQTCIFEKSSLDLKLVFDSEGKIGGIFFAPPTPKDAYILPPYNRPENYTWKSLEIITGEFRLPAILTVPRDKELSPAFILIHGSGAHDKDETIGPNKPFADLAAGLSSNGFAVLRYAKRNFVYGEKAFEGKEVTVYTETIEDVLSAIQLLKETPGIDASRIYLLGHSLGAMVAPRIAAQIPDLAGIIMMAGNARPLEDLILEQVTYLSSGQKTPETDELLKQTRQQVINVKNLEKKPDFSSNELPLNIPASYWLDLKSNNQVEIAGRINCKILILQGERDYQVTMTDYKIWNKKLRKKKNVTLKSYPALNHLFMEGEGKSTPIEYEKRGNVPWYVIKDILDWAK